MGCKESKPVNMVRGNSVRPETQGSANGEKLGEASINSLVTADPRSPMDARQMFKIKQSWKGIRRNMELTGVEMFLRCLISSVQNETLTFVEAFGPKNLVP
ncbi:neuroglobin-1 [Elysia marginata]|uniref:Neuroglobin-1 n=1 Tax=Elysia marginata TaxID=1093978 RepID=A0AAV4IHN5_9GAST|nr:neuroglobin-1 [Elysia marginata]